MLTFFVYVWWLFWLAGEQKSLSGKRNLGTQTQRKDHNVLMFSPVELSHLGPWPINPSTNFRRWILIIHLVWSILLYCHVFHQQQSWRQTSTPVRTSRLDIFSWFRPFVINRTVSTFVCDVEYRSLKVYIGCEPTHRVGVPMGELKMATTHPWVPISQPKNMEISLVWPYRYAVISGEYTANTNTSFLPLR
jgi:hypothetical protein